MKMWGGKVIIKGILDVEDAQRAVETGADAIIVSNHGGRQQDGAISSIRMLSDITEGLAIVSMGVGQHQMWAMQHYYSRQPRGVLSSSGFVTIAQGYRVAAERVTAVSSAAKEGQGSCV